MVEGFKNTEVGVIPSDWEVKKLGEIGVFKKGKGVRKEEVVSDGIACVRYGELYTHHNEYIKKINSYISQSTAKQSHRINRGDILFAGSGETKQEIGKCAAFISDEVAYAGGDVIVLTPRNCDSLFLGFLLNHSMIAIQKAQNGQGDAVVHIYPNALSRILIPLPPTLAEQTAIATALSDADALINQLEQLLTKKRNIKTGAMQELLSPKEGWVVEKLGNLFNITAGGDFRKDLSSEVHDERYPFPIYSNSLQNQGAYGFSTYYTNEANCITVTARGTIGYSCFRNHRFTAIGRLLVLVPKCDYDCYYFSEYINNKVEFALEVTGVPQLTAPQISRYEVSFPYKKAEQTRIAQILSDMDNEIEEMEKQLEKYKMLKQGMMQNLLTGKIRLV